MSSDASRTVTLTRSRWEGEGIVRRVSERRVGAREQPRGE